MINIPWNFKSNKEDYTCKVKCGMEENNEHILYCKVLNGERKNTYKYENIYNGNQKMQVEIFKIMKENLEKRQKLSERSFS